MRRMLAIAALLLAGCVAGKPTTITPKQAAQVNVMATPPSPLQRIAASEEHASEWPVWMFNGLFPNGSVAEIDLPANIVVKIIPFNHPAIVSTGTVAIAKK